MKTSVGTHTLTIPYSDELLLSLKACPDEFEQEARLLPAVKLYELNKISTGMAARLAGISRVAFMLELSRFDLSPIGIDADELVSELNNA